ncbi:N-acetylmuramoyl-L-alanine amidase [Luteimonas sp. SJ-92]|uniref:N-acetylmuramoyl-L-alanine amidase n=1 Tax=Luteimonas salinisoli TaxID=2752307 RepID=A0A853J9Y5_9GAMM|nr:N-acetylmuramoyl-L-alanine amidase [Luteimonas salinisoli]NZA25665.1 N-acetylmuramoyl-L-alanine amidase [Luteimonas salinisoli]
MPFLRFRLLAVAAALLMAGCAASTLRIDTRHQAAVQASRVQYLVLHYTVADFDESLRLLTGRQPGVSAHYLVRDDPVRVYRLVEEHRLARHAGESYWAGATPLNASSIGIEIVNPGYSDTPEGRVYAPYPQEQIDTVIRLASEIVARHGIRPEHVLGHADVAPGRKQDPGPQFPWRQLAEAGLILWPDAAQVAERLASHRRNPLPEVAWFQERLAAVGYRVPRGGELDDATRAAMSTFQMKYRPADIAGVPDAETAALLDVVAAPDGMRPLAPTTK